MLQPGFFQSGSGTPVALNGQKLDPVSLVLKLNELGGKHAVGRIDLVENRHLGITRAQEVGMQRVHVALAYRAGSGHQRLARHLSAEDALPVFLWADPAEDVDLERLEIEEFDEMLQGRGHGGCSLRAGL